MAKYVVDSESLTAIADAIREKTGKNESLTLAEMPTEVASIEGEGNTEELEAQIADLTTQNTEFQEQIWALREEKEHLADEVETLNGYAETLSAENAELTERIEELESGSGGSSGEKTALAKFADDSLTEVTEADLQGATKIGRGTFYVKSIQKITIPDGVTAIEEEAIVECSHLKSVTFGKDVSSIGYYSIMDCTALESITMLGTTPPTIEEYSFAYCNYTFIIYVPASAVDTYKAATNWSQYADRIQAIGGTESGGGGDNTGGESGGSTDQTALAGAYTDATFTTRAYTWDELLERGDYNNNGGMQSYENEPSVENAGYWYVYGQNYAFVIPDTITTGVGTEGCKALVFPSTTTEFKTGMEGTIDTIYIKATTPPTLPWGEYFVDCNYNGNNGVRCAVNIVVPVGCGNAYKTATNWSEYADYITEGEMPI